MKTCQSCHKSLPLIEFHIDGLGQDGHRNTCRHCMNARTLPTHQQKDDLAEATKVALGIHSFRCIAHCFRGFKDKTKDNSKIRGWKNGGKYPATPEEMSIRIGDMWALAGMTGCWFGR